MPEGPPHMTPATVHTPEPEHHVEASAAPAPPKAPAPDPHNVVALDGEPIPIGNQKQRDAAKAVADTFKKK
jgi:hypothetical protein